MRLDIRKNITSSTSVVDIEVSHKEETVTFICGIFSKTVYEKTSEYGIFEYINRYWETLSEKELDHIFSVYIAIKNVFNNEPNREILTNVIKDLTTELTNAHNLEKIYDWIIFKSDVIVPNTFEHEYEYSYDKQGSREQTYIRSDYVKLIALAIVIKAIIPVFGEYIGQTKKDAGTLFKEYYAFHLLNHSALIKSEAMQKLAVYIAYTIGKDKLNNTAITEGISSEDYPIWMLGLVIIRRLPIGDVRGLDSKANLITYIYQFVVQKIQSSENNTENAVKEKVMLDGKDDSDKTSALERYKIKHDISTGEIIELAYSVKDYKNIAYILSPRMTDELYNSSMQTVQKLLEHVILEPQITILQWVLKPVISPRGVLYLEKPQIVNLLGVMEAVLVSNGFNYLAVLATSYANISNNEFNMSSTESRTRISTVLATELNLLYPFQQIIGGSKSGFKSINPAISVADTISDKFSEYSWIVTASGDKVEKAINNRNSIRITANSSIKVELCRLMYAIGSRKYIREEI